MNESGLRLRPEAEGLYVDVVAIHAAEPALFHQEGQRVLRKAFGGGVPGRKIRGAPWSKALSSEVLM